MLTMYDEYENYIIEHKQAVIKALNYLYINVIIPMRSEKDIFPDVSMDDIMKAGVNHDYSKYSEQEFNQYAEYFYGEHKTDQKVKDDFNYAWLHHIHNNPHHWQHWVLINDEDGIKPLEMPNIDILEMIADWWSFSLRSNKPDEIFKWYDEHKENMQLAPETKRKVELILDELKEAIDIHPVTNFRKDSIN